MNRMMLNLVVIVVCKFFFIHRCIYMILLLHVINIALAYFMIIIYFIIYNIIYSAAFTKGAIRQTHVITC